MGKRLWAAHEAMDGEDGGGGGWGLCVGALGLCVGGWVGVGGARDRNLR